MHYVRVPKERVGVLIGPDGSVKDDLEKLSGCQIMIDSEEAEVAVDTRNPKDPVAALKVGDVIKAIARGFTPEEAFRIFRDDVYFKLIDIRDWAGKKSKDVVRIRGRLIGTNGKVRKRIEEMADIKLCVYGTSVGLIGDYDELEAASVAVEMILNGAEISSVNRYLEKKRRETALRFGF